MTNTAQYVIEKAYIDAAKLPRGGTPTAVQYLDGLERLNDLINLEQTQGLRLWLEEEYTLLLTAGKQRYSFSPTGDVVMAKPLRVKQASFREPGGNYRPLIPISREEWTRLANREAAGAVTQYFVEKHADEMSVYLWNVPNAVAAAGSVKLVIHSQSTNPASINAQTSFPLEWVAFLRWALAADLSTGMPDGLMQRCEAKAAIAKVALDGWDVEDAPTFFQPDTQWLSTSRFS